MPGICYIPGTYQHSHWQSFAFFGWCTCGICHIPTIHQPNVPSAKISHLHLEWAVCGDVCQMYTRIWRSRRNSLIFVPRCLPHICQVFGSQYSQVKSEGPLHIPCIYKKFCWFGICWHTPGICGRIWHTPGTQCSHLNRN